MTTEVIELIRVSIAELPFITKSSGAVQTQQQGKYTYPVARVTAPCEGDYIDMLPSSKEIGIAFFENISNTIKEQMPHRTRHRETWRLVVWVNMAQISPSNMSLVESYVMAKLLNPNFTLIPNYLQSIKLSITGTADFANPYAKYNLDENLRQYMMYPYSAFAINFDLEYFFVEKCLPQINVTPLPNC